jgi:glutamate-1-semialdehyde 2,1-aminomutase
MPLDPSHPMAARYQRSSDAHERRQAVIAGGVNSNVRLAGFPVPLTIARADGALLWDVDGNEYLDYAAGMGPMILGHSHPAVNDAVCDAVTRGQLFAGQSELEAEFAELFVGALPWIESIRIGLTGTEMDLLAARIARAVTGRHKILRFAGHYHGWLDPLFVDPAGERPTPDDVPIGAGQSRAAAADVLLAEWNDLDAVEAALSGGDVACVLMEPVMCNTGLIAPDPGYLEGVKALCEQHGALLVIDEVITGFRFGLTGAQGMFGVTGHISVYAKAVASGFPLAVLGSTTELLAAVGRGEINHSGTYNAGVTSVAAGVATLRHLVDTDPYPEMDARTQRLADGLRIAAESASVDLAVDHIGGPVLQTRFGGAGPIRSRAAFAANSDPVALASFLTVLQECGVRPTSRGIWFVSAVHHDDVIGRTLDAAAEALARFAAQC